MFRFQMVACSLQFIPWVVGLEHFGGVGSVLKISTDS